MTAGNLPTAFLLLENEQGGAVDAALVEAFAELDPPARPIALKRLIDRADPLALAIIVGRFRRYPSDLQDLLLDHVGDLFPAIRLAVALPTFEERAGAIDVIVRSHTCKLAYLLGEALKSRCAKTRERAAAGLHAMVQRWIESDTSRSHAAHAAIIEEGEPEDEGADEGRDEGPDHAPHDQGEHLAQALRVGIARWESHLQPMVLEAAASMADRVADAIRSKLEERRTKIARALRDLLTGTIDARMARFALTALTMPALRTTAARAITEARDPAFIRAILGEVWMLDDPEVQRGCRWIRGGRWLCDCVGRLDDLREHEALAAVRMIDAVGGSHESKMVLYQELIETDDDELGLAVIRQLVSDPSDSATDLLGTVAVRGSDELATMAARELQQRRPDATAQGVGGDAPAMDEENAAIQQAMDTCWHTFDRAAPAKRSELLATMRSSQARAWVFLRARCVSRQATDRARALRMVQALGVVAQFDEQVYRLTHDPDPLVRSLAITLLVELPGPTSRRVLRAAMDDPDARVQANAIEVLDTLDIDDRIAVTDKKLDSPDNRVRANAVKSLLRTELHRAGEVLLEMLDDSSRASRLSALWVVQRLCLSSLVERLEAMGRDDPDKRVRERATRIIHELDSPQVSGAVPKESAALLSPESQAGGDS